MEIRMAKAGPPVAGVAAVMAEMQRQIQHFVSSLNTEITQRSRPAAPEQANSLIPVIEIKRLRKT